MSRRPTITPETVAKIRELYAGGMKKAKIARELGLSNETIWRYATPEGEATIKAYQRARYERERTDPDLVERRRTAAREYARRQRAIAMADPNRPETKREAGRRMKAEREAAKLAKEPKLPGVERECCVCGVKFRTIYRNTTCSREHALEWKQRYIKRWRAERAGGIGMDVIPFGAAGGGHRVGERNGRS